MKMWNRLWQDDAGFVVSAELVLVATILVLGVVVGLNAVRNGVTNELADVAAALDSTNQGYQLGGVQGHAAATAGSSFADETDFCDAVGEREDLTAQCIEQGDGIAAEGDDLPGFTAD